MSFFAELKRRNVVRVGIAYVLIAWVFLQIVDFLLELTDAPSWVLQVFFIAAAVGLLAALIISWVYEMTPEGLQREKDIEHGESIAPGTGRKLDRLIIVVLAVAVVFLISQRYAQPPQDSTGEPAQATATADPQGGMESAGTEAAAERKNSERRELLENNAGRTNSTEPGEDTPNIATETTADNAVPSVAVLPFANMSPDPDNEYFADGISEELLNLLVRVDGLRVPSRTSSFAFKGQNMDIRSIAQQLEVAHVLEGSVRKSGNRVRITAQLIEVASDTHLWSETYDRELEDIFAVQDEISGHIVEAMKLVLETGVADNKPTENLQAYSLYLQGRQLFQQRGAGLAEAEKLLLQAVDLDPAFDEAWATLAMTYSVFPNYLGADAVEANANSIAAAERALAINPNSAEAKLAKGGNLIFQKRHWASTDVYAEVIADNPKHSIARLWHGINLFRMGYLAEALESLRMAVELDPASGLALDWYARGLIANGRWQEALEPAQRSRALGRIAGYVPEMHYRSLADDAQGKQALMAAAKDLQGSMQFVYWVLAITEDAQNFAPAKAWLETIKDDHPLSFARFHIENFGGSSEDAIRALSAVLIYDDSMATELWLPAAKRHRQSPAMQTYIRKEGILDAWRERGWPDLCRPLNDEEFTCD